MPRVRLALSSLCLLSVIFVLAGGLQAPVAVGSPGSLYAPHVPGEILIQFKPGTKGLDRASARASLNAASVRTFRSGAEHWRLGPGVSVDQAIDRMQRNPHVRYAEPNYTVSVDVMPNDPRFDELWGMHNTGQTGGTIDADIDADMAWGVSRGSRSVLVGVIDTGVDYNHPDLAANIWTNPGEIPGNQIDDDNNGFVDDVHGYDFINNDGDPFDDNGHGTHCSGTIGGVGNNGIGVAGVNWEVSIMGLKFLSSGGSGNTTDAVRAVEYATMMGVDLTSNSWGGGGFSQTLYDAIAAAGAAEIPFVAAAGNNGTNNDTSPHYPSNYDLVNVISVAATDHNDAKASFSNYGLVSVDIGAPGAAILSTLPGNSYGVFSGTSMATPHVAGVLALLKSRFPNLPAAQAKTALMLSADPIAALSTTGPTPVASGGRLNAFFAIADPDQDPPGSIGDLATTTPGSNTMGLTWTATGDDGTAGTATFYQVRYSTSPITEANFATATRAGNEPNPQSSGSTESMEVRGLDYDSMYHFAVKAFDEWGNGGPISNVAAGMTLPAPTVGYDPATISEALFTGETAGHVVTLRNDGVGTLDFTIPTPALSEPLGEFPPVFLDKGEPDTRPGILGSGGPDLFGYRWKDSDDVGGPAFDWVDISTIGTPVAGLDGDDENLGPVPIGFTFPFYGNLFNEVRVSTNGFLSFTSTATSYSNQALPSSGAPENLLAVFWDDLHFRSAERAFYYNDGSRFIVQFNGVDTYATGSDLTFEVILYPSGRIVYQYLSMSGTLGSATIGMQNAAKTDGLTVAFNSAYVHDNLAVAFTALPQWLTASPTSGRIPAGGSVPIHVGINASGLEGGTYPGQINIQNNDPMHPVAAVDVTLVVTGAPDAVVTPASLDFGDAFLGTPNTLSLTVVNDGTDALVVSGITSPGMEVMASPDMFTLAPHAAQTVTVTWTPAVLGPFMTTLSIASNDMGEPVIDVPVAGNAIPAPVVVYSPHSFSETLFSGGTVTRNLHVSNTGGSDLVLTAAADQGAGAGTVVSDPSTLGAGGPDAFGYRWRDSDEPGGPAFNWVDISATGTPITFPSSDDSLSGVINMGMSFPFYGNTFSSFKISTNGWLTFNTAHSGSSLAGNGTLPSTSLPVNSIAFFWDDLHMRSGNAKYFNDGSRFIIQYTNTGRYSPSTGQSYTFQLQLYPNGKILLQYLSMTPSTLNSATIGIQDATRATSLQVNYNTAYVHDNLAVQIGRTPDWITVTPFSATVPPGGSMDFDVAFDATDRLGGVLSGNVVIGTNIPGQETVLIPATLNVIGAPDAAITPTAFDYGTVYAGYPHLTSFQVINNGTDVLNVTDVVTTDPAHLLVFDTPGPTAGFSLAPGAARLLNLRWLPDVPATLAEQVLVHSDDPDNPTIAMDVTGTAIPAPVAVYPPDPIEEDPNVGDVIVQPFPVANQGGSDLVFSTSLRALGGTPVTVYPELELKKDEPDPRPGLLGSGGPDLFGYLWRDSDEAGGPIFGFVDISATGTPVSFSSSDDAYSGPISLGMDFPFYGNTFSQIWAGTNGWATFAAPTGAYFSNSALPSTSGPPNFLAAFWDDLHLRTGDVRYLYDGTRFILQYTGVGRFSPSTGQSYTFQIILYPTGRIVYQYLTMDGTLNSSTLGIQNDTRTDGLTVVFNSAYMHDNLAVEFRPPVDYITVIPSDGVIPPGGSLDLEIRIDTSSLIGGDYAASVDITTNDPARGLISVPVVLHVTGIPDIDAQPASLTFPTTYVGFGSTLPVVVRNVGTDALHIGSATISGDFSATGLMAPIDLPVGGTMPIDVTFSPTMDGPRLGSIAIASDDPDEMLFEVPLEGYGLYPPEVGVDPAFLDTALPPGGNRTKTISIGNTGGSDLVWTLGSNIISAIPSVTVHPALDLQKEEPDPRVGILGAGGPDLSGYRWTDSDEPGGPAFGWIDISTTGTPISFSSSDDGTTGPINLGMAFPFYGNVFSELWVSTNGWASFSAPSSSDFSNDPLPSSGGPANLLAVFWDDLHLRAGDVRYLYDGTRFILQYTGVGRFSPSSGESYTFQIILYPSGKMLYQYLTMDSTVLDSATIGTQNATRDDGLNVVYNTPYVHDGLAIQIAPIPAWVSVSPDSGVIPAGGSLDLTVTLDAMGLDDGIHEATIDLSSNDPYTPLVQVPVTLSVGVMEPAYLNFDPDVLNLSSGGNTVKMVIELPMGWDPHMIDIGSITLNDTVPALPSPIAFTDENHNGIEELVVKFDRAAVNAVLPEGSSVPVTVQMEIPNVQWFRGTTYTRTLRPHVMQPNGGEYAFAGQSIEIRWQPVQIATPVTYEVQLSRDGGLTWEVIASNLTTTLFDWVVEGQPTTSARVRVVAVDQHGVVGYDLSDGAFTIAATLTPPNGIGDSLAMEISGSDLMLIWKQPVADLIHGPADHYLVLASDSPQGPFVEIGSSTSESFREPMANHAGTAIVYYKVVAANMAGNSLN